MKARHARRLLRLPVRLRGVRLGTVVDVIVDPAGDRVFGFDVLCGNEEHRFLPAAGATAGADSVEITSTLTLLGARELEFYRRHGRSITRAGEGTPEARC